MRILPAIAVLPLLLTGAVVAAPPGSAAAPTCGGEEVTISGTSGDDELRGTSGADVVNALAGDDVVSGLGGADLLCGGDGTDTLAGGAGDDGLWGGRDGVEVYDEGSIWTGDTISGGAGDDTIDPGLDPRPTSSDDRVGDSLSYATSAAGVVVDLADGTATGEGADEILSPVRSLYGSRFADTLRGSDRREVLVGNGGSDRIEGRGGNDLLHAADGFEPTERTTNVILGGQGNDLLTGALGNDVLKGQRGNDDVVGHLGVDRLHGGPGGDRIYDVVQPVAGQILEGGPGAGDMLSSIAFQNRQGRPILNATGTIDLTAGNLTAYLAGRRLRVPTPGFENAFTPRGRQWTLFGTNGPNRLHAGPSSSVRIYARGGNDYLSGTIRSDVLNGGRGFDIGKTWGGQDRLVAIERVRD